MAVDDNTARVSLNQFNDMLKQQTFAGTGRADNRESLTRFDRQIDILKDMMVTKGLVDLFDFYTDAI